MESFVNVIGNKISTAFFGSHFNDLFIDFGEEGFAVGKKSARVVVVAGVNSADDNIFNALGVTDGVNKSESGAPRIAIDIDFFDFEMIKDFGDV